MSQKIILVLGPTASGKSQLALDIAQATKAPIINADSVQVYQGLDVGSSAPTVQEKLLVPHYLYGFVPKGELSTAAHHMQAVREILQNAKNQEHWLLCGGSGFYLQAIEKGMDPVSETSQEIKDLVEQWIQDKGWEWAHAEIAQVHGDKIHWNDQYRIRRALEVMEVRRRSPVSLPNEKLESPLKNFKKLKIGLRAEKEVLRDRVAQRVNKMMDEGFIQEVQGLLAEGLDHWAPLQSVGYFEVREYLQGRLPQHELVEKITISTMQLIKKQMTWFKRDPEIHWFPLGEEDRALSKAIDWMSSRT